MYGTSSTSDPDPPLHLQQQICHGITSVNRFGCSAGQDPRPASIPDPASSSQPVPVPVPLLFQTQTSPARDGLVFFGTKSAPPLLTAQPLLLGLLLSSSRPLVLGKYMLVQRGGHITSHCTTCRTDTCLLEGSACSCHPEDTPLNDGRLLRQLPAIYP